MTAEKGFAPILIVLVIMIAVLGTLGVYYLTKNSSGITQTINQTQKTSSLPVFSGKVERLSTDLGLIVQTDYEKTNNMDTPVIYYSAGKYTSGEFKGYTRYLAIRAPIDPSGAAIYIFASNDGQNYIYDKEIYDTQIAQGLDPYLELNKSKIKSVEFLPSDQPQIIKLDGGFALNRNQIPTTTKETGKIDKYGNKEVEYLLDDNFASLSTLSSPVNELIFYADKNKSDSTSLSYSSKEYQAALPYLSGLTEVFATDSTNLAYMYDLTRIKEAESYPAKWFDYQQKIQLFEKSQDPNRVYPDYPMRPNLRMVKTDIQTTSPLYDKYDVALPQACTLDVNTWYSDKIKNQDLEKIGTSIDGDIYILTDKQNPLLKYAYYSKIGGVDNEGFVSVNNMKKPTFEDYLSKNPLLFLKDAWGRWAMLGEYDVKLIGGCGKPVIYLYPEKETDISVSLDVAVKFDATIPDYNGGWKVKAYPDGKLVDLQSNKSYKYLYWAGQVMNKTYPKMDQGWVVEKENLSAFFNAKFEEMGFSSKEKDDFISYWVPEMNKKDTPYYKISFMNTYQLNEIFPMKVEPEPKSVFRIFMDWAPLIEKPATYLEPQVLGKIQRSGFTMVEWGGLKR
jgi:hypothetical protein